MWDVTGHTGHMDHVNTEALLAGLDTIREAPADNGALDMIVRRPAEDQREVLEVGALAEVDGLVGDNWSSRGSNRTEDGSSHPDMQLNVVSSRLMALVCTEADRRQLAGDQLHVDLDLSEVNLPAWTRLSIGEAVIEVTDQPHAGCKKFVARFGRDAMRFVNSEVGRELRLRGLNARVVVPGTIRVGDRITKL